MRFVFALALIAFSIPAAAVDMSDKPEWYKCLQDADCVITDGLCGGMAAINKNAQKEYEDWMGRTRPVISCVAPRPIINEKEVHPVCENKKCSLKPEPIYAEPK